MHCRPGGHRVRSSTAKTSLNLLSAPKLFLSSQGVEEDVTCGLDVACGLDVTCGLDETTFNVLSEPRECMADER